MTKRERTEFDKSQLIISLLEIEMVRNRGSVKIKRLRQLVEENNVQTKNEKK